MVLLALLVVGAAGLGVGALVAGRGTGNGAASGSSATSTAEPSAEPGGTLTVAASTTTPAANERVSLTGELVDAEAGVRIVVQRRSGGEWSDFPAATTTTAGGAYALDVALGRPGENVLRTSAPDTGAVSEPVTLTIG